MFHLLLNRTVDKVLVTTGKEPVPSCEIWGRVLGGKGGGGVLKIVPSYEQFLRMRYGEVCWGGGGGG